MSGTFVAAARLKVLEEKLDELNREDLGTLVHAIRVSIGFPKERFADHVAKELLILLPERIDQL